MAINRVEKTIRTHAWDLAYIKDGSRKFYRVYVTESGLCFVRWGRIGTAGQHQAHSFPTYDEARDLGLRQVYEKRAKGYSEKTGDIVFKATDTAISRARDGVIGYLDAEWETALEEGLYEASKTEVLKQYAEFSERINQLLHRAADGDLDTILDEYQSAEEAWTEIDNQHAEVTAAMSLVKATLMAKVMA